MAITLVIRKRWVIPAGTVIHRLVLTHEDEERGKYALWR